MSSIGEIRFQFTRRDRIVFNFDFTFCKLYRSAKFGVFLALQISGRIPFRDASATLFSEVYEQRTLPEKNKDGTKKSTKYTLSISSDWFILFHFLPLPSALHFSWTMPLEFSGKVYKMTFKISFSWKCLIAFCLKNEMVLAKTKTNSFNQPSSSSTSITEENCQ